MNLLTRIVYASLNIFIGFKDGFENSFFRMYFRIISYKRDSTNPQLPNHSKSFQTITSISIPPPNFSTKTQSQIFHNPKPKPKPSPTFHQHNS